MIEVRVLGPLRITTSDGRRLGPVVRQAKRAALLAYLAAATPRGAHRRDKLLALFWPESDEARARAALSQAVYVLRSALGEQAVVPRGDGELGLAHDIVWCDAVAFEEALDAGRPADALPLYAGDLLDGFFVAGAPEFQRWLDQERERLRQRAAEGAWVMAEASAATGALVEAERWARQAVRLLPADEAAVRRLMTFLEALGDRAAAIRAYEAFAWRLTDEYELEPSVATRELAAAIRARESDVPARRLTPVPVRRLPPPRGRHRTVRAARWLAAAVVAAAAVGIAWAWLDRQEQAPRPVTRFALDFAGMPPLAAGIGGSTVAVSPDGAYLAYVGAAREGAQLFLRPMDRLEARPIPHTRAARLPFFSPDGEWLGFVIGNTIRKVRLTGGPAITVWTAGANIAGASWGERDNIVFATPAGLWRVAAGGGPASVLAVADTARGERYRWPDVLPSGRAAVFTRVDHTGFSLAKLSLQTGTVTSLGLEGTSPRFVAPGYLVLARADGALLAAPFDPIGFRLSGAPLPLADGVFVGMAGAAKLGVSRNGVLAYVPEPSDRVLVLVDRTGREEPGPLKASGLTNLRFAPDGRRIAVTIVPAVGDHPDISLVDWEANTMRRVTFDSGSVAPIWSPDGRRIAFANKPGGRPFGFTIRWTAADGESSIETLVPAAFEQSPVAFTPDGRALVFEKNDDGSRTGLWILSLEGDREAVAYGNGRLGERSATLAPDGRWLAFVSGASGRDEVYVGGFPDRGVPVQVSSDGGREPRWSPQGWELFYRSGEGMVAVALEVRADLKVRSRTLLFDDRPYISAAKGTAYDVHPDGRQFGMIRRASDQPDIVVVLSWFEQFR